MKFGFYPRLAMTGIKQNKPLYKPYIWTCVGMVMMFYIITFLAKTSAWDSMRHGQDIVTMMNFGIYVMAIFSMIFLFYTNSFLIRKRQKEFGLYNILGMNKLNIAKVLFWENLIIAGIAIGGGLVGGIVFSKLAELALMKMLTVEVSYSLSISLEGIIITLALFLIIFAVILVRSLFGIHISSPAQLLRSENVGEKPPKANWVIGLAGVIILAIAYCMAVTIENPVKAMFMFFVAVVLVIIATYLIFIVGSVVMCRLLQKKKGYYYKANHFVSISSMAYRMKRNGAGLASICILGTMVLVTLATTSCLYFGTEESLHSRYPYDINIELGLTEVDQATPEQREIFTETARRVLDEKGLDKEREIQYAKSSIMCLEVDGVLTAAGVQGRSFNKDTFDDIKYIDIISTDDYNGVTGANIQMKDTETLIYCNRCDLEENTINVGSIATYDIKEKLEEFTGDSDMTMDILPHIFMVVNSPADLVTTIEASSLDGTDRAYTEWIYGIEVDATDEAIISITEQMRAGYRDITLNDDIAYMSCQSLAENALGFYTTYGALFFLGIILSIVFLFAAVLIIYYKQISEGYEDRSRFEIMQNVGMTKRAIRKSVNSQMLTVFLLPLLAATMHLAFAFPIIQKILMMSNIINTGLLITTFGISVLAFAVFYIIVYRVTSNTYYRIVSEK